MDVRISEDGSQQSFIIRMENGREAIRHKSHLRHAGAIDGPAKKVRFEEEHNQLTEKATNPKTRAATRAEKAEEQSREKSASSTDTSVDNHVQIQYSSGSGRNRRGRRVQ